MGPPHQHAIIFSGPCQRANSCGLGILWGQSGSRHHFTQFSARPATHTEDRAHGPKALPVLSGCLDVFVGIAASRRFGGGVARFALQDSRRHFEAWRQELEGNGTVATQECSCDWCIRHPPAEPNALCIRCFAALQACAQFSSRRTVSDSTCRAKVTYAPNDTTFGPNSRKSE